MHPFITHHLAEVRRAELLRSADTWRLAHPADIQPTKRTRWWHRLLPWRRAREEPACAGVLAGTPESGPGMNPRMRPTRNIQIK